MRLPSTLASQPIPQALFALYTSVVHHNYQNVYKNSERLLQVVTAEGADPQLGTVLSAMVHTFVGMKSSFLSFCAVLIRLI